MLRIKEYVSVKSVEEAYELLQKNRMNRIIGGMLWLKMQDITIPCAIDLSACELDKIEENEEEIKIGAMVTLHDIETSNILKDVYDGIVCQSVRDIVGVQFRNLATIGGSVYSRFGFSDILCALLALDCDVVTYAHGRISLKEFNDLKYERDVLTHIIIKKRSGKAIYLSERNSATDFPTLVVSASLLENTWRVAIGARPKKAKLIQSLDTYNQNITESEIDMICESLDDTLFESNMRASKEYRTLLAKVMVKKVMMKILEDTVCK